MRTHTKMSLFSLSVLLAMLTTIASAQMLRQPGAAPKPVPDAIKALKDASDYEKAGARADLVDSVQAVIATQGAQVLDPVVTAVQGRFTSDDPVYVVNCILALGEVKDKGSTNLLITVLSDTNLEYAYQAATALGDIWEGSPATSPELKTVNPALLALLYSDLPATIVYGPGIALVKTNGLPIAEPTRLGSDELRTQIDRWVASSPAALPTLDQLPYQVLARLAAVGTDVVKRSAIQALRQQRALGAIEPVLAQLAAGKGGAVAQDMGQLLGELSNVPYPPTGLPAGATAQQTADSWRQLWLAALKSKTDDKSIQYTWRALEDRLRFYAVGPDDATAQKIGDLYNVLLWQVPGPDALPAGASPAAKKLLTDALTVKQQMAEAVSTIETSTDSYTNGVAVDRVNELLNEPSGPSVALQFLPRLVAVARRATTQDSAVRLGNILWRVAAVPLNLNGVALEDRQKQLDKWVSDVRKTKPNLGL